MNKISRSKLELFTKCPRCFWLDVKYKVKQPPSFPYTINSAIDYLFKQEFDHYRGLGQPHPIMQEAGIDAIPYSGPEIDTWRDTFSGVQFHHQPSDFLFYGGVDDVWVNPKGELIVVDYKSTGSNTHHVYDEYVRQLEIYQWLLAQNGHKVSPVGYWVYARANKTKGFGHGKAVLPFDIFVESAEGKWDWIPDALMKARITLDMTAPPQPSEGCIHCKYRKDAVRVTTIALQNAKANEAAQPNLDPA